MPLVIIGLIGAIEVFSGLSHYSTLFGDISKIPGFSPGGLTILASIVLHPILGLAAVAFALIRRLRLSIIALGLFALTQWASDMPSVIWHGFDLSGDAFVNAHAVFKIFLQPGIGLLAIAAAWRDRHLTLATVGVMLPTLVDTAGVVAFAIGVMLYGF